MIHVDAKIQDVVETLHGMLRSLCTAPIAYDVTEDVTSYKIRAEVHDEASSRFIELTISRSGLHTPYWETAKYNIVRSCVINWLEKCAAPVDSRDIVYKLHPACALVNVSTRETER
jgi:hypothetical protein